MAYMVEWGMLGGLSNLGLDGHLCHLSGGGYNDLSLYKGI